MSDTPQTDECVKENRHIRFLQEDHYVGTDKYTYENPIVFLCQRLERKLTAVTEQRDEARETVESLTTTAFDLLASLEKARDERDRLADALQECREDSVELLGERDWWQNETRLDYQQRYQETRDNVTRADAALQSLTPNEP
jgi:chromosome segregation ATPase